MKVRATIIFLLLAAIATFILAHLNQINAIATAKERLAERTIQKDRVQNSLRQNALKYEKEMDSIAAGQKP